MGETPSTALQDALDDLRGRAAAGDLMPISDYVKRDPNLGQPPALLELILADAKARLPAGLMPSAVPYVAEFPEHASAIQRLFQPDTPIDTPTTELPKERYDYLAPPRKDGDLGMLGEYRVIRKVNEGGMGVVFEGYDSFTERVVALKVIRPALADFPNYKNRFKEETQAVAKLHHANVLTLLYAGVEGRTLYQVMPFLRGESLATKLNRERTLSVGELIRLTRGIASGLSAAHSAGLIHRDIKPSNLWLEPDGDTIRPIILDFGLVLDIDPQRTGREVTSNGLILGSFPYMSPEQGKSIDRPVDGRSDLFSLGAVLYEAATGVRVFERGNNLATIRAAADFHPEPLSKARPELPAHLCDLIHAMLAKHPNDRPASAAAVVAALDQLGAPTPIPRREPEATPAPEIAASGTLGRKRWLIPASVLATLAAGLGIAAASGLFRGELIDRPQPTKLDVSPQAGAVTATVDMEFINGPGRTYRGGLRDAFVLPARPGDQVRASVQLSAPAYCYVFFVTASGKVLPLYPWKNEAWGTRQQEAPVRQVYAPPDDPSLPLDQVNTWTVTGSDTGLESVLVVVRTEKWDLPDEQIRELFQGLKPHHELQSEKTFVSFENGAPQMASNLTRDFDSARPANAPHLQIQTLIARKLQPHAASTAAVSFAKVGK